MFSRGLARLEATFEPIPTEALATAGWAGSAQATSKAAHRQITAAKPPTRVMIT
jgi:hypothetical protein